MSRDLLRHLVQCGHEVRLYIDKFDQSMISDDGIEIRSSSRLHRNSDPTARVFITHPEIRTNVWNDVRHLPYVGIVHNTGTNTMRSIERCAPDLTIANSAYTSASIPIVGVNTGLGVHVIHPPLIPSAVQPMATRRYVTAVNVSEDKGGTMLYDLARANPSVEFLAVKGGHGVQVIDQPSNVLVLSSTPDMSAVYAMTRVLIFPSRNETYGKVVGEAMLRGIPVIASDLPGIREAGGDAAIYAHPLDFDAWNFAIKSLQHTVVFDARSKLSCDRAAELVRRTHDDLSRFEELLVRASERRRVR
jgi:hypothetical protein